MSDAVNKAHSDSDIETKSYQELHRPASEFASRSEYLDHELQIMKPRRYGLNLPGRDFRFELEDWYLLLLVLSALSQCTQR